MAHFKDIGEATELDRTLNRDFISFRRKKYIEVGRERICMPLIYKDHYDDIKNFQTRNDDVFVCGFPKSGTRWTNELVWLITNNFDCVTALKEFVDYRCPRLEQLGLYSYYPEKLKSVEDIDKMASPRCISTHLHWSLLPDDIKNGTKQPKMVVVLRNSRDVCLSYYHQNRSAWGYSKSFDDFCDVFLTERIPLGPYWSHVSNFWDQRHRPNVFILKYEDMITDLKSCVKKVTTFLEKTISDDDLSKVCRHLSFESMKNMKSFNLDHIVKDYKSGVNPYVRNGVVGGHKTVMSIDYIKKFKEMDRIHFEEKGLTFAC